MQYQFFFFLLDKNPNRNKVTTKLLISFVWLIVLSTPHLFGQGVSISIQTILDEGDEYIIDRPQDASVNDQGLIAIAEVRQAKVLIFDKNGRFIREIGRRGNGPGEMQMVYHIELIRDRLLVFDFQLQRVSSFDVHTGKVIATTTYKDLFGGWVPSNTTSFSFGNVDWVGVVVADLSVAPGKNTQMRFIAVSPELKVSESLSYSFDVGTMLKNREEYSMSFYRPVSNYNLFLDSGRLMWAPYHFDGILFYNSKSKPEFGEIRITVPPGGVQNKVFSNKSDQDSYISGRNLIASGGSSPSGPQNFVVARHSLQATPMGKSGQITYLYSEYSKEDDAYVVQYSTIDVNGAKEVGHGKAEIYFAGSKRQVFDLRKVFAVNKNGTALVQYIENGEVRLAIATFSLK